jgi:hypothetical protein
VAFTGGIGFLVCRVGTAGGKSGRALEPMIMQGKAKTHEINELLTVGNCRP